MKFAERKDQVHLVLTHATSKKLMFSVFIASCVLLFVISFFSLSILSVLNISVLLFRIQWEHSVELHA